MKALRCFLAAACAAAIGVAGANTAGAAIITETISFTATGFGSGVPINPVIGSFTLTFDPLVTIVGSSSAIAFKSVNVPQGSLAPYFFYNANLSSGTLIVCSESQVQQPGSCSVAPGFNEFDLQINNVKTHPTLFSLAYAESSVTNRIFQSFSGTATVVAPGPVVGAGLPGLLAGFGALLAWYRRRRAAA